MRGRLSKISALEHCIYRMINIKIFCFQAPWPHKTVLLELLILKIFCCFSVWPTWCTKFLFYNKFISCLYMFRAHVLIIRRSKLYYTYRCDVTTDCVMQFWPPDDKHMCSKHVEAWNKLIVKQKYCASSWLITEINILRFTVSKTSKLTIECIKCFGEPV